LKTEVLVWWCGWNDWLSGSCRGATVRPKQAWKSDVKLTSSYTLSLAIMLVVGVCLVDIGQHARHDARARSRVEEDVAVSEGPLHTSRCSAQQGE